MTRFSIVGLLVLCFAGGGHEARARTPTAPQREAALDYLDALAVAVDAAGNVFFTEGDRIRKVATDGQVSTMAGADFPDYRGDGGPATSAALDEPMGLAVDALGNLVIADSRNNRVRKVTPEGTITTIAGTGVLESTGDGGPATAAGLMHPVGVAVDRAGNLFIDEGARIRKVVPDGIISTLAGAGVYGSSGDGGHSNLAQISANSGGMAVDADGNLFFAEFENRRVRRVTPAGIISTVAEFGRSSPWGIALGARGNLFVSFPNEGRVLEVLSAGRLEAVAGTGLSGFSGDRGPAIDARLASPRGIAVGLSGDLYVADHGNNRIRKVTPSGTISTVGGPASDAIPAMGTLLASSSDSQMYSLEGALFFFVVNSGGRRVEFKRLGDYDCSDSSTRSRASFRLRCYPATNDGSSISFFLRAGDYELQSYAVGCSGNCGSPWMPQAECVASFSIKSGETITALRQPQASNSRERGCRLTLSSLPPR